MWILLAIIVVFSYSPVSVRCQTFDCHDDPAFTPEEGPLSELQFTWLGVLQYVNVKQGNPHYFRAPRVILVSKQFALSTAVDAAEVPKGYAFGEETGARGGQSPQVRNTRLVTPVLDELEKETLSICYIDTVTSDINTGNVAFSDYERDETECGITLRDLEKGAQCEPAVLIMPILDVLVHPEYKHFGVRNSVALLKLVMTVRSGYMLPVCLPYKNFLVNDNGAPTTEQFIHVDFISTVPRDFAVEEKEVSKVSILAKELCRPYDLLPSRKNYDSSSDSNDRLLCTSGCGFHSGAPTVYHEHTGHWSIVAIAIGGPSCPDPLRSRRPPPPPSHVALHHYVPWITAAITGRSMGAFAKDDPFGFIMPRAYGFGSQRRNTGWVGHWWLGGIRCYDRGDAADDLYKFYHEIFQVTPSIDTYFTYYLEIAAPQFTRIVCVKIGMPTKTTQPRIWDLNSQTIKLRIPVVKLTQKYKFQVEAWGHNETEVSDSTKEARKL